MRRKVLITMASLAAAMLMSACGKQESNTAGAPGAASDAQAASAAPAGKGPMGVAFVYIGNPGDAGWTYAHEQGAKAVEAKYGDKVTVTRVENVPEGADSERVFRDLASKGNKLVFGTSFGYMDSMVKTAADFPDVTFEHATGFKTAPNLGTYDVRTYEGAHLAGVVGGHVTKTNVIGYVASVPIPEVIRNIDAFTIAAREVNPKVKVKVVWINSWFDPGKERQAAESLVGQGADVLMQNVDSAVVMQVAEEKKIHAFGWNSDMSKFGPNAHLASAAIDWSQYYVRTVDEVMRGAWKNTPVWGGIKEDEINLVAINDKAVPEAARKAVTARHDAIRDGKYDPFTGPLKGQDGKEVVPAGKTLNDDEKHQINWFVEGVEGSLPKQ
ncbi:BMP family ABC transporter substrate-binding protein [Pandoraea pulmonicola]|uniref:BMP family ABC transporter substrate-binding protein n=1 Tax=Pandoraea pulmonicola TaxID=93221 RepID=A0AAJ4Z8E9_PANPU|nr:BMP family ABC transporter substrate-binding protein [Pandoraea pulmonicola]AJC22228.1 BMP family ABC transporter substrate-binding protein [Pandoraea pulmonicola]SUA88724.1 Purine-binding protein BAB2_0673 precursor [Pandoraea pulmonicola]